MSDKQIRDREDAYTGILDSMAKVLGYKLEQMDIMKNGYYPQALADDEIESRHLRRLLTEMLQVKLSLSVRPHNPSSDTNPPPASTKNSSGKN